MASNNGRRARGAAATADAARLGTEALVQPQTDTALLLARQAVALADTATTRGSLLETLGRQRGLVGVVQPRTAQFGGGLANDELVSPDGSRLLMNGDNGVYLIDTATGTFVGAAPVERTPDDYAGMPYPTGFVDGGRSFLVSRASKGSGSGGKVELQTYTAADGKPDGVAEVVPGSVQENFFEADRLRVSPDGQVLLSLLDRKVRVWRRSGSGWGQPTLVVLPRLPTSLPDQDRLLSVSYSKDDSRAAILLSLQGPNFAQPPWVGIVLATDRPRLLMPMIAPVPGDYRPSALALSRDGTRLAVGHADGRVTIQDVASGKLGTHLPGHTRVSAVAWGDTNSRLVVGHDDGSLQVLDPARSLALADFPATGDNVSLVALRTNRLVSQTNSGAVTVRSLDLTNGFMTVTPIAFAHAVAAGPAGSMVAVGGDGGVVTVYDQTTLHRLPLQLSLGPYERPDTTAAPAGHRRVSALAISPDGKTLVAADRVGHLRMWSLPDGRMLWSRDDVPTSFLALSPDGHYLATSGFTQDPSDLHPDSVPISTRVSLWDLRTRKAVLTDRQTGDHASPNTQKPRAIAFSPDSATLAAGFFEAPLAVYDVARHVRRLTIDTESSSLVFSPDNRELLVEDHSARIRGYESQTGKLVEAFPAPSTGESHLLFTADGQWLVGSNPTSMSVWQADTHRLVVSQLPLPSDGTNDALSLATTSDRRLFVATQTSLASITMDAATWSRLACSMAGRALTQLEWTQFLPGRPYHPACAQQAAPQGAR